MAETAKKVKTATKRRKSRKVVKDVVFDISEISTAINQIQIKDGKVGIIFQGRDVKEQHLSLGKKFNELVRSGTLSQIV